MDPVSAIVTALAVGAAAGLKDTATEAVKDAYNGLKQLIARKHPVAVSSLNQLEEKPASDGRRIAVREDLEESGVQNDAEVIKSAEELLAAVRSSDPTVAQAVGVDLKDVEAAALSLSDITARGESAIGARLQGVKTSGDVDIKGVTAESDSKKR